MSIIHETQLAHSVPLAQDIPTCVLKEYGGIEYKAARAA